jgi:antitoxin VapB
MARDGGLTPARQEQALDIYQCHIPIGAAAMNDMAKIFWTGRSQAVRLPKEYRFDSKEVRISREGGRVVLEAVEESSGDWIEQLSGCMDDDWAKAVEAGRLGPEHMPDGPSFD